MGWQNKTSDDRRGLRKRRATRRTNRASRTMRHWQERAERAANPADEAALEYDRARATIREIREPGEQTAAWEALANAIAKFNEKHLGIPRLTVDGDAA